MAKSNNQFDNKQVPFRRFRGRWQVRLLIAGTGRIENKFFILSGHIKGYLIMLIFLISDSIEPIRIKTIVGYISQSILNNGQKLWHTYGFISLGIDV